MIRFQTIFAVWFFVQTTSILLSADTKLSAFLTDVSPAFAAPLWVLVFPWIHIPLSLPLNILPILQGSAPTSSSFLDATSENSISLVCVSTKLSLCCFSDSVLCFSYIGPHISFPLSEHEALKGGVSDSIFTSGLITRGTFLEIPITISTNKWTSSGWILCKAIRHRIWQRC